jgi:catechol 2,3-dioxygenase-like lactoylglutathione lyase family enzyme
MSNEKVVPVFPCRSLKTTLEFYSALGFEILYEQHKPYVYGSVKSKSTKSVQESGHLCLVTTEEIQKLHTTFSSGIKQHFGKQLRSGIPRLGTVNTLSKDQRFNLLDPDGNRLIVIEVNKEKVVKPKRPTPLSKAISVARLDAYSRDLPEIVPEYFDEALKKLENEPNVTQFRAFVLRADVAAMLQDEVTREKYIQAAGAIILEGEERLEAAEEIARLRELEAVLENEDATSSL